MAALADGQAISVSRLQCTIQSGGWPALATATAPSAGAPTSPSPSRSWAKPGSNAFNSVPLPDITAVWDTQFPLSVDPPDDELIPCRPFSRRPGSRSRSAQPRSVPNCRTGRP